MISSSQLTLFQSKTTIAKTPAETTTTTSETQTQEEQQEKTSAEQKQQLQLYNSEKEDCNQLQADKDDWEVNDDNVNENNIRIEKYIKRKKHVILININSIN